MRNAFVFACLMMSIAECAAQEYDPLTGRYLCDVFALIQCHLSVPSLSHRRKDHSFNRGGDRLYYRGMTMRVATRLPSLLLITPQEQ